MILTSPTEMAYYRLATIKFRLKMEAAGLKGHGGAMRPRMAKEFGLKPRDSFEKYIEICQQRMNVFLEHQKAQNEVDSDRWAEHQAEEHDYYDRSNDHD